jgi:pyruvate,water dikinase
VGSDRWIVSLADAFRCEEALIGGKATKLAQLAQAGFRVPPGFCLTTQAYEHVVQEADLDRLIRMELGRKPFASMRWEEIWDTALRIRSAFLAAPIPQALADAIDAEFEGLGRDTALAVRSSAPGEDAADRSFAGLHESVVGVVGLPELLDAVRVVWASLWSDAALLYRQELSLDPSHSQMAAVVQVVIDEDVSGVAFGRDPRNPALERAVVEAVPGPCSDLVDGLVDPDRWILDRTTGQTLEWRPGERDDGNQGTPILDAGDLGNVLHMLHRVEALFHWPPDTEWTGQREQFTLLQARPITTAKTEAGDPRSWYLSLRPGMQRLNTLAKRVAEELVPDLETLGARLASEAIEAYDDAGLASTIEERYAAVQEWRQIYLDEFIPFAHGVRQLGMYYNDVVRPADPYEFVGLLKGQSMAALRRNQALMRLADRVRQDQALNTALRDVAARDAAFWPAINQNLSSLPGGQVFLEMFEDLRTGFMDVAYDRERLSERPDLLLNTILEMAEATRQPPQVQGERESNESTIDELERRLMNAVGAQRHGEARQVLAVGRLSWRLRDDDNLLVGRLESQLLRALELAANRLRAAGRLDRTATIGVETSPILAEALRDPEEGPVVILHEPGDEPVPQRSRPGESPRQLVGQPASPGMATGRARIVRTAEDLGRFQAGRVLVCDAIQPTMTHLIPLASAIVERRGGMLIHGAIIARELGIPCVNGIADAAELLHDDQVVTVDGFLGIVTIGPPEFDLEGVS